MKRKLNELDSFEARTLLPQASFGVKVHACPSRALPMKLNTEFPELHHDTIEGAVRWPA